MDVRGEKDWAGERGRGHEKTASYHPDVGITEDDMPLLSGLIGGCAHRLGKYGGCKKAGSYLFFARRRKRFP